VWDDYLSGSRVDYDSRRFGPAPDNFADYLDLLRSFVVVMDRDDAELSCISHQL